MPVHVDAEVIATRRAGAYRVLSLAAPGVADGFRPGMFVAVTVGTGSLGRRSLWIHRVRESGTHGACLDVVVEPRGQGGTWLAGRRLGDRVPLTGPLGRPFALPREPVACLLVGEGVAAASLFTLAERLRERACPVTMLVAADDEAHLVSTLEARRLARAVTVATADGSVGTRGSAEGVLGAVLTSSGAQVTYAAGSPALLRAVAEAARVRELSAQVALAPPMPCGTGLCGACLVPVQDSVGAAHWVRACVEGPAMRADRVRWDAAPQAGGAPWPH
ncbi:iron-sulfur cluster-binding protein [Nocardioides campestrisoli]|uniref:iron-sulfur cluster-binding protein n=1 Tax=Nocardioides campestrisoli TaxID=2736757 RepID=UPI00163D558C|nr:dihydroorotate dehydrogenase electron transfer subunit [Nocardioides campestrisoli]